MWSIQLQHFYLEEHLNFSHNFIESSDISFGLKFGPQETFSCEAKAQSEFLHKTGMSRMVITDIDNTKKFVFPCFT